MELTLAIDYGATRVGVAASAGFLPRPLDVLQHGALEGLIERLLKMAQSEMATRILIGLPVNADGTEGTQAKSVRYFAQRLANATPLPVWLWNEYGSSQAAQAQMIAANTSKKSRKTKLDALAAAAFLQDYIDQNGEGAERVFPVSQETDSDE
jgi:putative Holliday junction resolvase